MGYDPSKLTLLSQSIAGKKQYVYDDTGGETTATYQGTGWFTDAKDRGADTGDLVKIYDKANAESYDGVFITVQDTGDTQGTVKITDTD